MLRLLAIIASAASALVNETACREAHGCFLDSCQRREPYFVHVPKTGGATARGRVEDAVQRCHAASNAGRRKTRTLRSRATCATRAASRSTTASTTRGPRTPSAAAAARPSCCASPRGRQRLRFEAAWRDARRGGAERSRLGRERKRPARRPTPAQARARRARALGALVVHAGRRPRQPDHGREARAPAKEEADAGPDAFADGLVLRRGPRPRSVLDARRGRMHVLDARRGRRASSTREGGERIRSRARAARRWPRAASRIWAARPRRSSSSSSRSCG